MLEIIENIATSFQDLDQAYACFNDSHKYKLSDIYDDWIASDVTIPL